MSATTLGAYHKQGDDEAVDWPQQRAMVAWDKRREREAPIKTERIRKNEKHKGGGYIETRCLRQPLAPTTSKETMRPSIGLSKEQWWHGTGEQKGRRQWKK